jgi:O-antigen/teichoic acid export membrane protein
MGEKTTNYFSVNIDKLIIGKILGSAALGYYSLAWQIIIMPLTKINPMVTRVAFPVFSIIRFDTLKLNEYYNKMLLILMVINFPIYIGLFYFGKPVVSILYGASWMESANLIQILSFVGLAKSFGNPGGAVVLSHGRADVGFWWNILWSIVITILCVVFVKYYNCVRAIAYAQLIGVASIGWVWHYLIHKYGKINYKFIVSHAIKLLLISLLALSMMSVASHILPFTNVELFVVELLIGSIVYLMYISYIYKKYFGLNFRRDF